MSLTGQQVGKYRIGPLLGEGSMAEVYVGEHIEPHMARKVAIKALLPEHCSNAQVANRFMNEARALGRINHPGVVSVYDVQRMYDGRVCIIMEFLHGQTLRDWLHHRGAFSVEEAVYLTIQLADALAAAHQQNIIHRDIKPDNIFIVTDQAGMRAKILDFGIAKLVGDSGLVKTGTKAQLGTAPYMPPEQFRSSKDVDHRSDMYSLGCVFFEMLTCRTPFVGRNIVEQMRSHAYEAPPQIRAFVPTAPPAIEQLFQRLLAKNREERFASMQQIKQALEIIQAGGNPDLSAGGPLGVSAGPPAGPGVNFHHGGQQHGQHAHHTGAHEPQDDDGGGGNGRALVIIITAAVVLGMAVAAAIAFT